MKDGMNELAAIRERIDEQRLVQTLEEAVARYSPSFAEQPATEAFAETLESGGLTFERQVVGDPPDSDDEYARENLLVRVGPQPPALLWVGHVDTVATTVGEIPPSRHANGKLFGLGTADMKSGCAAAVEAALALVAADVPLARGLCVALVVGEEEEGDGAHALLDEVRAPLAIVGEPTGLAACRSHFGYMECLLRSSGRRAHAALPELGGNAIHAMLSWLTRVLEEAPRRNTRGATIFNPREIRGGTPMFAVPEACVASLDVHFAPGVDPRRILDVVAAARDTTADDHSACQLELVQSFLAPGYGIPADEPLVAPVEQAYTALGWPYRTASFRSHSDASTLYEAGVVPVVLGPGRLELAHTPDEHVELAEVVRAAHLYAAIFHAACVAPEEPH